jgi:DNA-binding FadR family transcriptional regulator
LTENATDRPLARDGTATREKRAQPAHDPIERFKLADHVQSRLLSLIQTENMKPGDPLPSERELMRTYSVGRPSIREAMQNLKRMGLIEINHGERPRVAAPSFERMVADMGPTMRHLLLNSPTTLDHLREARATFEVTMAEIAARKRSAADLAELHAILAEQKRARSVPRAFLEADGRFHRRIAMVSGNPIFASLSQSLFAWLTQFHFSLVRKPGTESLTLSEHRGILEAIEEGDAERAAKEMADHLNRANKLYHQDSLRR